MKARKICAARPAAPVPGPGPTGLKRASAFTLIEVVISGALMSLILVSAYLCFSAAISSQKIIEPRIDIFQNARVALALMTADLRCACPLSKDFELLGTHRLLGSLPSDNLDFATHNYTPHRSREADFCETSFFLDKDPESGQLVLFRRRNPAIALDPLAGGRREELARGVRGLQFEYYDGYEWYDTWGEVEGKAKAENSYRYRGNLTGMPEAVRITLWFDSRARPRTTQTGETSTNEPPLVFQTVARLNLAANSKLGTSGSGSPGSESPAGGPGTPAVSNPGSNQ